MENFFSADLGLPSYGVSSAYNNLDFSSNPFTSGIDYSSAFNLGNNANTSGGMFSGFGNFLNSNFMSNVGGPLAAAGLSGFLTNRAADNYGRSAREAAFLGGQAALLAGREAAVFADLGEDKANQRRQKDALFQLNMQKSKPFQDLLNKGVFLNIASQDAPGAIQRASQVGLFG
jgi:hypothetical protein